MTKNTTIKIVPLLLIPLITYTILLIGAPPRLADNIIISVDFVGLGYLEPPMVMASISLPGVATLTPTSIEAKGNTIQIKIEGIRGMFEEYRSTGAVAGPTITLALIDYENMSIRVRQVILTPLTLAILKHSDKTDLKSLRTTIMNNPLLPYHVRLYKTMNIEVNPETLEVAREYGVVGEVLVPRGISDLVDTRPSYRAEDAFNDTIPIRECIRHNPNNIPVYHDASLEKVAYKSIDRLSQFYGFLVNGSTPKFWVDHVPHDPEGTWRTLVSSAYAAVYYIEYTPWEDPDIVLESILPGVTEYIRSNLQTPNNIGQLQSKRGPERGYLVYGSMDYWLGLPGEDRWLDTRDLYGVTEVTASNVPLLQVTYNTTQYTGNPDSIRVVTSITIYHTKESLTGFGILGFYTSSTTIFRDWDIKSYLVDPGATLYYYSNITYYLGNDVGVLLFDVIGIGQDSCGDYWIIVEPIFIYYVDTVPWFAAIQADTSLPGDPTTILTGKTGLHQYYTTVYPASSNAEFTTIAEWGIEQYFNSPYTFYIGSPPYLDIILMLFSYTLSPPAKYIIDTISILGSIIYERSSTSEAGTLFHVTLHTNSKQPINVPVLIDWRVETLRYFLVYGGGEPLPLVGSKMIITLADAQR